MLLEELRSDLALLQATQSEAHTSLTCQVSQVSTFSCKSDSDVAEAFSSGGPLFLSASHRFDHATPFPSAVTRRMFTT